MALASQCDYIVGRPPQMGSTAQRYSTVCPLHLLERGGNVLSQEETDADKKRRMRCAEDAQNLNSEVAPPKPVEIANQILRIQRYRLLVSLFPAGR